MQKIRQFRDIDVTSDYRAAVLTSISILQDGSDLLADHLTQITLRACSVYDISEYPAPSLQKTFSFAHPQPTVMTRAQTKSTRPTT